MGKENGISVATVDNQHIEIETEAVVEISTNQGLQLFRGHKDSSKPPTPSLTSFTRNCRPLIMAAQNDDPYADNALLHIEKQLEICKKQFTVKQQFFEERVTALEKEANVQFKNIKSANPVSLPLKFGNEYAKQAALLVARIDKQVLIALALRGLGELNRATFGTNVHNGLIKPVRHLFHLAQAARISGVSRTDFRNGTQSSVEAEEKFGALSEDVLRGERRPELIHIVQAGEGTTI